MPTTFKGLLATSFLVALTNLLLGFVAGPTLVVLPFAAFWLMFLTSAVTTYGKRGLWLLFGLPLALFWPLVLFGYFSGYVDLP